MILLRIIVRGLWLLRSLLPHPRSVKADARSRAYADALARADEALSAPGNESAAPPPLVEASTPRGASASPRVTDRLGLAERDAVWECLELAPIPGHWRALYRWQSTPISPDAGWWEVCRHDVWTLASAGDRDVTADTISAGTQPDFVVEFRELANHPDRVGLMGWHQVHETYCGDSPAATAAAAGDSPAGMSDAVTPAAAPPAGRYYFSYYPDEISLMVADAAAPFVDPAIAAMIGARAAQALLDATVRPR